MVAAALFRREVASPSRRAYDLAPMDRAEYEAYRKHHNRVRGATWITIMSGTALIGFTIAMLWSFAVGVVVAAVLALTGLELHLRWDRARWIKRFPEAASTGTWRRRYGLPGRL
jgi:hypothetical protein